MASQAVSASYLRTVSATEEGGGGLEKAGKRP